jgi:hypothetical protein
VSAPLISFVDRLPFDVKVLNLPRFASGKSDASIRHVINPKVESVKFQPGDFRQEIVDKGDTSSALSLIFPLQLDMTPQYCHIKKKRL